MDAKIINPKQRPERAFYRIYILPRHIDVCNNAKNKERAKLLKAEMDEHLEWVKENGYGQQLKDYIGDQQARQDAYDKVAKLKGELSALRGTDMNRMELSELTVHAKALEKASKDIETAEKAFAEAKKRFVVRWESGPKASIDKG